MEYEDIKIIDLDMKCPVCHKGKLKMIYKISKIPHFGGILTMSIKCDNCEFKVNDIFAVSNKGTLPEKHQVKTFQKNMSDLVVLSAGSKVEIPEIGYEVEVMSEEGGEITTVEGILLEAIDVLQMHFRNSGDKAILETARKIYDLLQKEVKTPSGQLTISVIDRNRRSAIIPADIWIENIEKERDQQLKLSEKDIKKYGKELIKKHEKNII